VALEAQRVAGHADPKSHERLLGAPLLQKHPPVYTNGAHFGHPSAVRLFTAPRLAVLAHNTLEVPTFTYGSAAALEAFGLDWNGLVGMESRRSAEAGERAARQVLLDEVASQGYSANYRGVRISRTGRRFEIQDAVVWNLVDDAGLTHGQAAAFRTDSVRCL